MLVEVALFVFGLFLLVKGSDFFVDASSRFAKKLGISEFIIGLTLVAIGTSLPELWVCVSAAVKGHPDIIVGNILGSNIANIGLIISITALFIVLKANKEILERDSFFVLSVSVIAFLFAANGIISVWEALILLLLFIAYIFFLFESREEIDTSKFESFIDYFLGLQYLVTIKNKSVQYFLNKKNASKRKVPKGSRKVFIDFESGLVGDIIILVLSLVAIVFGAGYLIDGTVWFAGFFGVPENLIALSVIAVGTSLPELWVCISAARKGYGEMILGNILGSNVSNLLLVGGVSGLITSLPISGYTIVYTFPFMILLSAMLVYLIKREKGISHMEGGLLFLLYAVFMVSIFRLV